jgi:hypothetical protein
MKTRQNIQEAFQGFIQKTPSLQEADQKTQLMAFVTTQEKIQEKNGDTTEEKTTDVVKKELIPYLLLDFHILETTPDYK